MEIGYVGYHLSICWMGGAVSRQVLDVTRSGVSVLWEKRKSRIPDSRAVKFLVSVRVP